MKKILIYDIAAESGGAKTVLFDFYRKYVSRANLDVTFVTSIIDLQQDDHMHLLKLPWSKKSFLHRLYCDEIFISRYIRKKGFDEVLSLQNTGIPRIDSYQVVYLHNAIPFTQHKFRLSESRFLWTYQNIKGWFIKRSLSVADRIIVQSEWMKKAVANQCALDAAKIDVEKINFQPKQYVVRKYLPIVRFFFPASELLYKNHKCIIEAVRILLDKDINGFEVVFTLGKNGAVSKLVDKYFSNISPFVFAGYLNHERMEEYYLSSVLIFPSYLETVGIPLLEAKSYKATMIVADCEYAHETVGDYERVFWFKWNAPKELADIMKKLIENVQGSPQ